MQRPVLHAFRAPSAGAARPPGLQVVLGALLLLVSVHSGRAEVTHCLPADPVWSWVNPLPHGQTFTQVRWVPELSKFVAMGDAVMTSTDGVDWTLLHTFPPNTIRDFWWNGTTVVAVGNDPTGFYGVLYTSTNFTNWTEQSLPSVVAWSGVPALYGITWNGSTWVATGLYGAIYTSPDAATWTLRTSGTTNNLLGVTWTGTRFVAAGALSTLLSSTDGTAWTPGSFVDASPPSVSLGKVFWNGSQSKALAIGFSGSFRSSDGLTWETIANGTSQIWSSSLVGGEVYGFDHGFNSATVYHSTDGTSWSSFTVPALIDAIASNGSIQVGVGYPGRGASNESGTWQSTYTSIDDVQFFDAVYGSNGYVAVGGTPTGRLYHSDDGATWTTSTSPVSSGIYTAVATDGAGYVAVSPPNVIVYSADGVTWQDATATSPGLPGSFSPWDVTWGPPGFVAVGPDGLILHSADGIIWAPATSGTLASFFLVQWTGERYVAISDVDPYAGTVVTSLDGVFWQVEPQPVPGVTASTYLNAIVSRPGLTLLMGSQHKTWTSPDGGRSWVVLSAGGSFTSMGFAAAIQIEGEILAAVRGGVEWSADGAAWTREESLTSQSNAVLVAGPDEIGNDQLVLLGLYAMVQRAPLTRTCAPPPTIFIDGFESGTTSAWSLTEPAP